MARPTSTAQRSRAKSGARGFRAISRATSWPNSGTRRSSRSPPSSTPWIHRTARPCGGWCSEGEMARADRAFGALLALALVSAAVLIALFFTLVPRVQHLLARGAEDTADIVAVLVLGLAFCGIALGFGALLRQVAATAVLIRSLVSRKVRVPAKVRAAAIGLGLEGRIDVVVDGRPFSFCYWFFRPRICLSTELARRLDREELRAVLLHERYHLRHRDPLRLVVARYFAAGLYVIPVVDELLGFYALEKEIAADEDAVREAGGVCSLSKARYKGLPDAGHVSLGPLLPGSSPPGPPAPIGQALPGR